MRAIVSLSAFLLCSFVVLDCKQVSAAIVGYTDYASYQTAATGSEDVRGFDSLGPGNTLSADGDVTFSSSGGNLQVYATDGISDGTVSPSNFIGNGNFLFRELESESIMMNFGAGRSAAGVFVVYEGTVSTSFTLSTAGGSQSLEATSTVIDLPGAANGYFLGLVDDSGANSIFGITLNNPTGNRGYYFDSQTSFLAPPVAIPEPGSIALLLVIGGVTICRRQR